MYIKKRSTMQANKVKVDFINRRKKYIYMPRMQWQMIDAFVDETDWGSYCKVHVIR